MSTGCILALLSSDFYPSNFNDWKNGNAYHIYYIC